MRWVIPAVIAFGLSPGFAEQFAITDFSGGLNSQYSSLTIADNEVQDALNVYFDEDAGVVKREGFEICGSSKAYTYNGAWSYSDSGNSSYLIFRASDAIIASNQGCTFSVRIATVTSSDVVNAVNALGYIWFVDRTQGVYFFNGTSTTYVSGSPHGQYIAEWRERICVTGLAHPNGNDLYCSAYLDGSDWTTSSTLATGAVLLRVGLNDAYDNIQALFSGYNDAMQIFKNRSIYALYGFDKNDFQIRTLSREAGCVDQASLRPYMGGLVFASERGIEFFNGVQVQTPVISDKVRDKLQAAIVSSFNEASWTQTSLSDFSDGSAWNTYIDTSSIAGSLRLFGINETWGSTTAWQTSSGSFTLKTNFVESTNSQTNVLISSRTLNIPNHWIVQSSIALTTTGVLQTACVGAFKTISDTYGVCINNDGFLAGRFQKTISIRTGGGAYFGGVLASSAGFTADISTHSVVLTRSATGFMQAIVDGVVVVSTHNTSVSSFTNPIIYCIDNISSCRVGRFDFSVSTGTFYSAVKNAPSLASWSSLTGSKTDNDGTHTFFMRSSTNAFTVLSATPTWTEQTINTTISIATGTYFQLRDDFAVTAATQTPTLNDFTVSWFEGTRRPPMTSITDSKRYYLSLATSTANSQNSATLVLSPGPVWSFWDLKAGAFVNQRGTIYHANNESNGKIYTSLSGINDDGSAINAYIKTKDYSLGDITKDKLFGSFYLISDSISGADVDTSYFINRSTTSYALHSLDLTSTDGILSQRLNFPLDSTHPNHGKTISFKFSNDDLDERMKLYGGILNYRMRRVE